MSHFARVGVILVFGALLLGGILYLLSGRYAKMRSYSINVVFENALGLQVGAKVLMAGVDVGTVGEITLTPDQRARLQLNINKKVGIPEGSQFTISSGALIGEKFVDIRPARSSRLMPPNAVVDRPEQVKKPFQIEDIAEQINKLLSDFQQITLNLNRVLGDPMLQREMRRTLAGLSRTTARMELLVMSAQGIVNQNQVQVARTMQNMADASAELKSAMADVHSLAGQPGLKENVGQTAESLRRATDRLDAVMQDVREVTGDPEVTRNLKETAANLNEATAYARDVGERVDKMVSSGMPRVTVNLPRPHFTSGTRFQLESAATLDGDLRTDLTLTIPTDDSSGLKLGLFDFADHNRLIAQRINWLDPRLAVRYGIFAGQVGVGVDYDPNKRVNLTGDLYDPEHPQLDLRGRYYYSKKFGVVFGMDGILSHPSAIVGIQWRN